MSLDKDIWVVEKNQVMVEGGDEDFAVQFLGATVVSNSETKCYKNGAVYPAPLSGSDTESGDTVSCQTVTAQANDGGSVYKIEVKADVDGNTEIRGFLIYIVSPEEVL